ncbi:MAG: translocation/assembly module TamB [Deltaproteobacteria bacterium]|nr:translocation/assembly module TamB [Deltaproteobacteria bacterium]
MTKNVLIAALKISGALLFLALLAAAALMLWLRSAHADGVIARLLTDILNEQGIKLEMRSFSGPLPGKLNIRELTLSDSAGPWFSAREMGIQVYLPALLRRELRFTLVYLENPELTRLPEIQTSSADSRAKPDASTDAAQTGNSALPLRLPLDIRLEAIKLVHGKIGQAGPDTAVDAREEVRMQPPLPSMSLEVEGSAYLSAQGLSADLKAALLHPDGSGLTLSMRGALPDAAAAPPEDHLDFKFAANEAKNGILAWLTGKEDLPAYALQAEASGPPRDWQGKMRFTAGEEKERLLEVNGMFALSSDKPEIDFAHIMDTRLTARLQLTAEPGSSAPQTPRRILGSGLHLAALASLEKNAARVETLTLENTDWLLALKECSADFTREDKLSLRGNLLALLKNSTPLESLSLDEDHAAALNFIEKIKLDADISAQIGKKTPAADILLGLQGRAEADISGEKLQFDYNLDASLINTLADLKALSIDGMGLTALARGSLNLDDGGLETLLEVFSEKNAPWQDIVERAFQLKGTLPAGRLSLNLSAKSDEMTQSGISAASLRLEGSEMLWPAAAPPGVLADDFRLEADLTGSSGKSYELRLKTLESGLVSLRGEANIENITRQPGLHSNFTFKLASLSPFLEGNAFTELSAPSKSSATPGSPRPPETPGATGGDSSNPGHGSGSLPNPPGLTAEIQTSGPLSALKFSVQTRTGGLRSASGMLIDDINSSLNAERTSQGFSGQAELACTINHSKPVNLNADWEVTHGRNNSLSAAIRKLKIKTDGILLQAGLEYTSDPDALSGESLLEIENWRSLSLISGLNLSGSPAKIRIKLEENGQTLRANWQFGKLGINFAGEDSRNPRDLLFTLDSSSGDLNIANLFNTPQITMNARIGGGKAGNFSWRSGEASVVSRQKTGSFNLTLQGRQREAAAQNQAGRAGRNARSIGADAQGLALNGVFKLEPLSLTVNAFSLSSRGGARKIQLQEPALVNLSRGLQLPKLSLLLSAAKAPITPGGHADTLTGSILASADLSGTKSDLKLKIQNVPLGIISLVSTATLPEGNFSLDLDLLRDGRKLSGNILAETSLLPAGNESRDESGDADGRLEESAQNTDAVAQGKNRTVKTAPVACPYLFQLSAAFSRAPSPAFPQLKPQDGVVRLSGQGRSYYADAPQGSQEGSLEFDLPFRAEDALTFEPALPLGMRLNWQGPAGPLWELLPLGERYFSGYGRIALELLGSLRDPQYHGSAYLIDGRYEDKIIGLLLDDITLEAKGDSSELGLLLSAGDGLGGKIGLQGALLPAAKTPGQSRRSGADNAGPSIAVHGQISHLRPLHRDDLMLQLSGLLSLNGPLDTPKLSADIEIERGEYTLIPSSGASITTLEIADATRETDAQTPAFSPDFDATLRIPGRFFIRGYGLDSEWAGEISAKGLPGQMEFSGDIRPVRGYFNLLSKPFAFSGGNIALGGGKKIDPILNLELSHTGPNITAFADITGTAARPVLAFRSLPPRPKDQILAEVLFGKDATSLSHYEAIQLASGLNELSGGKSLDLLGSARKTLGVDMLRISGGNAGARQRNTYGSIGADGMGRASTADSSSAQDDAAPRLEAGKYITGNIYVGVEQGVTEDSTGIRVEVELKNNLTLQGRSTMQSSDVGLGWKKDY